MHRMRLNISIVNNHEYLNHTYVVGVGKAAEKGKRKMEQIQRDVFLGKKNACFIHIVRVRYRR